jgi:hypothetical protein
MLKNTSKSFREFFLLKFTEQLILHSKNIELLKLEELLRRKNQLPVEEEKSKKDIKEEVHEKLSPKINQKPASLSKDPFSENLEKRVPFPTKIGRREISPKPQRRVLKVPSVKPLPPQFSHVQPKPTEKNIDLGKLNVLVQDSNVRTIECEGENTKVIVTGSMGRKPTSIVLSGEEIDSIINKFSQEAKIPTTPGVFKVAVGKLTLTAMISESVGSRFVIKKIEENSQIMGPPGVQRRF